jgi:CubicO group peptidase (beta-lactamase class C family)
MTSSTKLFMSRLALLAFALLGAASADAASALPMAPPAIDDLARRAMKAFEVPGMAVGVVKDGQLVYARGFGVRELGKSSPVTPDTVFQIGSNTKAFTAAALAILVDEGRIRWDDKVIDHLPQFRMYDPYVTREFTIRDLLSHRSGLGLGAGDLMFYPSTDFTRAEIMKGLRFLKPVSGFRTQYDYDNSLYMVAGEIIPAVTGKSWEDFVEERILKPLKMSSCVSRFDRLKSGANFAEPHAFVDGVLRHIPVEDIRVIGAAGSINCNVGGLAKWVETQLAAGQTPDGSRLFSEASSGQMWSVTTARAVSPELAALLRTHFEGYGLGWDLLDEFGYKRVSHTGGVPGTSTWIAMIPELRLGVIVLTNTGDGSAMEAVGNEILAGYAGGPQRDLVAVLAAHRADLAGADDEVASGVEKALKTARAPALPLDAYVGRYSDPWRGDATIRREGERLVLKFSHTDKLEGDLVPYRGNLFVVHWNDRSLHADAFVLFSQSFDGGIGGMTMRSVSPATDFSFDFQDLDFSRVR